MTLFERAFADSDVIYNKAVKAVDDAIAKHGADKAAVFPNTAYGMGCYYAYTGDKDVTKLGDLKDKVLPYIKEHFLIHEPSNLTNVFNSGVAAALSAEVYELTKYACSDQPYPGDEGTPPLHGHLSDAEIRELGLPLVVRDIPGVAVMIGPVTEEAGGADRAAQLIKSYQSKGIFVFLVGGIIDQAIEKKINLGFKVRVVACGYEISSVAHVVSLALRAALIFGGITPGDRDALEKYTFERIFAFVNAFEPLLPETVGYGAGAICLGFPVITNDEKDVARVPKSLLITQDTEHWDEISLEARDIKIKITNIDIPVAFSNSFEGEIIRRADMYFDANGSAQGFNCFELVRTRELSDIEDHKIELIGDDFDKFEPGAKINFCVVCEVAGKNMQSDFEPVFERKFHAYLNCMEGVMHTGQRDIIRIRVSKAAFEAGLRAKHFGEVVYCKIMDEFEKVVDKCQVTIITDPAVAEKMHKEAAIPAYDKRDERLMTLTDENVDVFYSCVMCQSFSPSHVCIVTPERLGLCGAVSWLDAKATYELDNTGPCQMVGKGGLQDENIGRWNDVNDAVRKYSRGALENVTLYSIMEDPMTSCGCFECICGIEPASNGVVIVNREYPDVTPIGMTFADLASMTGGGVQTPGFMGHGKHFIASKKFMRAEGGIERIVWMPKDLKDQVAARLNQTAKELYGIDDFASMIGDETTCADSEALMAFLEEKQHPVLKLDPLM